MKSNYCLIALLSLVAVALSCQKDEGQPEKSWEGRVLIVNEGPFQTGTGTIDALDPMTGAVYSDVFYVVNGRPLGNIVQSLYVYDKKIFITVNNANRLEVADLYTFQSIGSVDNLPLPRYFIAEGQMGYVSCWDNTVKAIDLMSLEITGSIGTGTGPDEMAISHGRLFVINSGGFGVDSTVTVIDQSGMAVISTLVVGHRPVSIIPDATGSLWVLCAGRGWNGFPAANDTPAKLVKIDPESLETMTMFGSDDPSMHPDHLAADLARQRFYFNSTDGIHSYHIPTGLASDFPLIPRPYMFYGLGFDDFDDLIYAADPVDFVQRGLVYRYRAADGSLVDSVRAGIIPSGFWFLDR